MALMPFHMFIRPAGGLAFDFGAGHGHGLPAAAGHLGRGTCSVVPGSGFDSDFG
jgi:hypothetical protein